MEFVEQKIGMEAVRILWSDNTVKVWLVIFLLFFIHLIWSTIRYYKIMKAMPDKDSGYYRLRANDKKFKSKS